MTEYYNRLDNVNTTSVQSEQSLVLIEIDFLKLFIPRWYLKRPSKIETVAT